MIVEYDCIQCGTHVRKIRTPANMPTPPRFCSQQCKGTHIRGTGKGTQPNIEYTCVVCGKLVKTYRSPQALEDYTPKYCSIQCTGRAQRGQGNPAWSGGRHKIGKGYIVVFTPDHPLANIEGFVLEHRLVMERIIGRFLDSDEVVHHINGIVDDNRPENLQLFPNQGAHSRHHIQMRREAKYAS